MNDMCRVIVDMELSGIKIDREELGRLRDEYLLRQDQLGRTLNELASSVLGDTPINLNSPEQLSMLLFSRKVKSKEKWCEVFNLGLEHRGAGKKPRRPFKMKRDFLVKLIRENSHVLYKTKLEQCGTCKGSGFIPKFTKGGVPFKKNPKCLHCSGKGVIYLPTVEVAGFKCSPWYTTELSTHGVKTDSETLELFANRTKNPEAREFLNTLMEYNKVTHYLDSFIEGMDRGVAYTSDSILHPQFNQVATATGRLSSKEPNFQNIPRGTTFPIKRAICSRFQNGKIIEGDFAQLEFAAAAELSGCKVATTDIINKVDVHTRTAKVLTDAGQTTGRQDAKAHTFKPLYGGTSGTDAEQAYYAEFEKRYTGIAQWHESICNDAVRLKRVVLPTGRQYNFPNAKRNSYGGVSGGTTIKNYPVQGFATGDISPAVTVEVWKLLKERNLKSKLINIVHDSIIIDTHPEEINEVLEILDLTMGDVYGIMLKRYGIKLKVPFRYEVKIGDNWLNMNVVDIENKKEVK